MPDRANRPPMYALLVGIDSYRAGVARLRGCVADVEAVRALLTERVPGVEILMLTDQDATRAAVTAAFTAHLGQAGPGQTALFWYAGHGSQRATAAAAGVEPDGLDETLVLYDSRDDGGRDLTDKELGALIAPVAATGAHVVIGLDCCHSGSGTREPPIDGVRLRRAPTDLRATVSPATAGATAGNPAPDGSGWEVPARHVLIAACRSDQTAKEIPVAGTSRGVLTVAFEHAFSGLDPAETYRDLLRRLRAAPALAGVSQQTPQLEVVDAADYGARVFSGAVVARSAHYLAAWDDATRSWYLDAGAVHGIPQDVADPAVVALYPLGGDPVGPPVETATVVRVLPHRSALRVPATTPARLERDRIYRAVVISWPLPKVGVVLDGAAAADGELVTAIAHSPLLVRADTGDLAVRGSDRGYRIFDATRSEEAVHRTGVDTPAATVVSSLEQMVRWRQVAELDNPGSAVAPDAVLVEFGTGETAVHAGETVTFPYVEGPEGAVPQTFSLTLRNTTTQVLYCAVLVLSESYAIDVLPFSNGGQLPPARAGLDSGSLTLRLTATVPTALWERGVVRRTDIFKVIVCTDEFDPLLLVQGGLPAPDVVSPADRGGSAPGALDRLLRRVQDREVEVVPDANLLIAEWSSRTYRVVSDRPTAAGQLSGPITLAGGVQLTPPDGLTGSVTATSSATVARDVVVSMVPPLLTDQPELWLEYSLGATRGGETALDVLEFHDVANPELVSREHYVELRLAEPLGSEESLLVLGFDGENHLVVGSSVRPAGSPGGTDRVRITTLPPAIEGRSLGSSIRLLLRRFVRTVVGDPAPVVRLAVATVEVATGTVVYDDDPAHIRAAVAQAQRVLLLVHGIIGDTEGMVLGAAEAGVDHPPIADLYDVVLTFDYENLATPISETAAFLAGKLGEVGLDGSHAMDIVAHSMGGLVSRWMIEISGGAQVHRLITAGTPNGGSPWSRIEDWAITILSFGLNRLAEIVWPAKVLGALVRLVEVVDRTLDDMAPNSAILRSLYAADDPGVQYMVLHGNRALVVSDVGDHGRIAAVLRGLKNSVVEAGLKRAFLGEVNDLAVSEPSALRLPSPRVPAAVTVADIACDHMTYFASREGRAAIAAAIAAE